MPKVKTTVKQAVERFVAECRSQGIGKEWDLDNMLDRVCAVRGCEPDDDGTDVWRGLSNHLKECAKQKKLAKQANAAAEGESGEGTVSPACENGDGSGMAWHEVGPGTDPIRFLTRPNGASLRSASVAMQEYHGRR